MSHRSLKSQGKLLRQYGRPSSRSSCKVVSINFTGITQALSYQLSGFSGSSGPFQSWAVMVLRRDSGAVAFASAFSRSSGWRLLDATSSWLADSVSSVTDLTVSSTWTSLSAMLSLLDSPTWWAMCKVWQICDQTSACVDLKKHSR
jgi:hypothetical protein